jgi:hypothetical protein
VGSLTERQKSIIIGCLLGDGSMRCKSNALLEINHALKEKVYVDWKYKELFNLVNTSPRIRQSNAERVAYRFTTLSLPALTKIYKQFYCDGKKILPKDIKLNPLTIAIWFMDDGCKSYNAVYFNSQYFSKNEQQHLIKLLKQQYGITATLNKDKHYYRIRIAVNSVKVLKNLIVPYMLPELLYKFPMTP